MSLLVAAALDVGAAVAKSIVKLWVKDSRLGDDISSSLIDLLKSMTPDMFAQRKVARQFGEIGDKIGKSLLPLFEIEGAHLNEGDRSAVALAVAETFNKSKLSSSLLVQHNLEPTRLAQHMLETNPNATNSFSEAATELYKRIITESCTYIVDISSQLPSFTEYTFAEVLEREDLILAKVDQVLNDIRKIREDLNPFIAVERFEIEYRDAVARNLDVLQLIGADVSLINRRHKLSVAYITLSVERKLTLSSAMLGERAEDSEDEASTVSVNVALARSRRLLIRGLAGSGKTTLLQWIAVRAATKSFEDELADWNKNLPFYIQLRSCVQSGFPRPEDFPGFVAPLIADTMPKGWAHTVLKSGRAIVLVDGIDEVPESQRENLHSWLKDLVGTFKDSRFIVSSRPYAIEEGWMNHEAFSDAELQPMELADIYSFVDHWHDAMREELPTNDEKNELRPLAHHLKEQVRRTRTIRTLATSPLLCAMLCALNRNRRQLLPVNRLELYKACCSLLLERRDKESHVDFADYPALNLGQRERLLQDLAYWMIQENLSEAEIADVDKRFARQLAHMPNVSQNITGTAVRELLVKRTGIIREPAAGKIDFTHRTFEDFFAAQAALDATDIEKLVANAHNDQWRDVIILASGLAPTTICEQLIAALIKRGDEEKSHRYQLHILAVSCFEAAIQLGSEVMAEVEKRLSQLVPPKNTAEAQALAVAGKLAVKYLKKKGRLSARSSAACVRALAIIAEDDALDALEGYSKDSRPIVENELLKAWDAFDREAFAKRVLLRLLQNTSGLRLECRTSIVGIQYATNLTKLSLLNCRELDDLAPLAGLINLTKLSLSHCRQLSDLAPLAGLINLTKLSLSHCRQLSDLAPLTGLTSLTELHLPDGDQLSDLSPIASLINLTELYLPNGDQLDLTPLAGLPNLEVDLQGWEKSYYN